MPNEKECRAVGHPIMLQIAMFTFIFNRKIGGAKNRTWQSAKRKGVGHWPSSNHVAPCNVYIQFYSVSSRKSCDENLYEH